MSQKTFKRLRQAIGFKRTATTYQHTPVKTVMVDTGRLDGEGKPILEPQVRIVTTCTGERADYLRAKKVL